MKECERQYGRINGKGVEGRKGERNDYSTEKYKG
jgi:hypothetical protein